MPTISDQFWDMKLKKFSSINLIKKIQFFSDDTSQAVKNLSKNFEKRYKLKKNQRVMINSGDSSISLPQELMNKFIRKL